MEEALRKILEAVEKNEITVDEAVELIRALKEKNKVEKVEYDDSGETENVRDLIVDSIVVKEGETFEGDVVVMNGDAVVKGIVKGNLSVVSGKLFFSGEVFGDLDVVGSKIKWHGGKVHGNLNMIACKEEGTPPKVEGELVRYNNAFIKSILFFIKPFIHGIEVKNVRRR